MLCSQRGAASAIRRRATAAADPDVRRNDIVAAVTGNEETMRHPRLTIAAIAVAALATVGGVTIASAASSSSNSPAAATSTSTSVAVAGDPTRQATVQTASATVQGTTEMILVDANGLPLYTYKPDTATTSHVSGQLGALWPPLVAAAPTGNGVTGPLTSVMTSNGKQVAYNGHFLYTFVEDRPGHVTGEGVQNFFVATPNLAADASNGMTAAPSKSGNGYSYGY
jgi:predicted lipoprotein with Yx(FWY)xxD motif